ncbi:hypothetical protein [Hymenobacter cheonanensis]|uniref:hypothetical protein n=1 Tax=Hymenobacter sp. CA2-7 TaxID=3063993 RepID=UPI0027133ABB|nr:hypothetical protein [Hymenobacter sp. CA2-7]MDO7887333.1 hypothetical protein [Hymenobacter sp. CA2-7]
MNFFGEPKKQNKNLHIRALLKEHLSFDGFYWYPLHSEPKARITEYFEADTFERDFGINTLITILKNKGYTSVWEITELGEDEKISLEMLGSYGGIETIYCDEDAKWAIYFSHENTVTLAGEMIVEAVKSVWVNWGLYKDPWK